jgi:hypothetical protein
MDHVRYWRKADITICAAHIRFQGQSRHGALPMSAFAVVVGGKADMPLCGAYVNFDTGQISLALQQACPLHSNFRA